MATELIVEVGNSHEGSLGVAKSFVDMAVYAGANIVKFQMHLAEHESSYADDFRIKFSEQDKTRIDYWNRVSFTPEQWKSLSDYCNSRGIEFLCTPFSVEAAELLLDCTSVQRWKVGSGDAVNCPLIDFLVKTKLPLIISTGLVNWGEINTLVQRLSKSDALSRTTLMHCVSEYPTALENSSLNLLEELRTFNCAVGLSDHSGSISPSLYAISSGVSLLEVHMTPHPLYFGPDVSSSLEINQIKLLSSFIRDIETLRANYHSRDWLFDRALKTRTLFRKGLYWKSDLEPGVVIQETHLKFLKPSAQVDASDFEKVIGRTLKRRVLSGSAVQIEDLQ
jgi:N-acetylneuraminate synthase